MEEIKKDLRSQEQFKKTHESKYFEELKRFRQWKK